MSQSAVSGLGQVEIVLDNLQLAQIVVLLGTMHIDIPEGTCAYLFLLALMFFSFHPLMAVAGSLTLIHPPNAQDTVDRAGEDLVPFNPVC